MVYLNTHLLIYNMNECYTKAVVLHFKTLDFLIYTILMHLLPVTFGVFKITVSEFCFSSTVMDSSFKQESSPYPSPLLKTRELLKARERNGLTQLTPLQQMICSSSGALVTSCFSKWNYSIVEKLGSIYFMLVKDL